MSLDLYQREVAEDLGQRGLTTEIQPGTFDNFAYGTGMSLMRAGAETGRAASMAVAAFPVISDALFGTDYADAYFKFHDDVFQDAVEYWTPQPGEVGVAGEITGQLLGTVGLLGIAPSLAVAKTQLSVAEDLTRKGVDAPEAIGAGTIQGLGLGTGIWMPTLGRTLTQRVLLGGALSNAAQGVVTRGLSDLILEGTPGAEDFSAFNWQDLTLDTLLGAAFGGIAHLSPAQRAQGERAWERLQKWGADLKPSEVDAIQTLRQAQHLNVDSLGGKPAGPIDTDHHVQRVKRAIEQMVRDEPVDVSDLPAAKVEPDGRFVEAERRAQGLIKESERVRAEEGIAEPPVTDRRVDTAKRKAVADMTPDEMRAELLVDPLTGIKNRRALDEMEPAPVRGSIDADGLKWINDNLGHHAGDQMLRSIAKALSDETENAFRIGGDEFAVTAKTDKEAGETLERVRSRLEGAVIKQQLPDGSIVEVKGVSFSYGIGKTIDEAEAALKANKADRERAGLRGARGSQPAGVSIKRPKGQPDTVDHTAGKAEQPDPVALAAREFAVSNPEVQITVGHDIDGKPVTKSIQQYLDDARFEAQKLRDDTPLLQIASACLLGGA